MEEKLTHVQALADERWECARQKQKANETLERRKTDLVAQLQRMERYSYTREQFELAVLRKDVAVAEEELENGCDLLGRKRKATAQDEMQMLAAMKERTEHLRRRINTETLKNAELWQELRKDQEALQIHDRAMHSQARERHDEMKEKLKSLRELYVRLEKDLEHAMKKQRELQLRSKTMERRYQMLQEEFQEAKQFNESMSRRLCREQELLVQQPMKRVVVKAVALERQADRILRDLNDFDP